MQLNPVARNNMRLIAGAYTREGQTQGLYILSDEGGVWQRTTTGLPDLANCSWLESGAALSRSGERDLLAVEENGSGKGRLARYDFSRARLDRIDLGTDAPCHILLAGEWVLVSNYSPGLVSCISLHGGGLGLSAELEHSQPGQDGPEDEAQDAQFSHAHQAVLSPDGEELAVADLGFDRVYLYDWPALRSVLDELRREQEQQDGTGVARLRDRYRAELELPRGEGPRHLVYSEDGLSLYILTEDGAGLWHYVRGADGWKPRERFSLGDAGTAVPSGLVLSPDQALLAAGVRGSNVIRTFVRNRRTGFLEPRQSTDCGGDWPRSLYWFDNETLLVCNERSGDLQIFSRDGQDLNNAAEVTDLPGIASVTAWH